MVSSVFSNPPVTYLRSRLQSAAGWPYSLGKQQEIWKSPSSNTSTTIGLRILLKTELANQCPKKKSTEAFCLHQSGIVLMFQIVSRPVGSHRASILDVNCFPPIHNFSQATAGHSWTTSFVSYPTLSSSISSCVAKKVNKSKNRRRHQESFREGKRSKIVQTIESPRVSCCCAAMEWAKTRKTRATCWVFQELPPAFRRWICYNSPKVSVLHNRKTNHEHLLHPAARIQAVKNPPVFPWRPWRPWRSFSGMKLK